MSFVDAGSMLIWNVEPIEAGTDSKRNPASTTSGELPVGEWVELALEVPSGDELGRMRRHSQPEEAAWRRIRAAERRVDALTVDSAG